MNQAENTNQMAGQTGSRPSEIHDRKRHRRPPLLKPGGYGRPMAVRPVDLRYKKEQTRANVLKRNRPRGYG